MPAIVKPFWYWLKVESSVALLRHLRFSVLALGDRSYAEFCAAGRKIDARLEQMGVVRIFPRADCDTEYESDATERMEGALAAASEKTRPTSTGLQIETPPSATPANAETHGL